MIQLRTVIFAALLSLVTAIHPARADEPWRWASAEAFDACTRNRYLDSFSQPGVVKLTRRVVITDDMGAGYNDFQTIKGKTQARKTLVLDDANVTSALLQIGGGVAGGCEILVNGKPLEMKPLERNYWNGDFDRFPVPPAMLVKGENTFVFRAKAEGQQGSIRVERSQSPNRSAVSRDGGASWDTDHFGDGGYIDGELQVRLAVERYAPEAWIASPVIDLARSVVHENIPYNAGYAIEDVKIDSETPAGTAVKAFVRTGTTPDGYEENWSRWYAWPAEKDAIKFERFAQWRVLLSTTDAQKTPVLKSVTLPRGAMARSDLVPDWKVDVSANQAIVRSSYDFAYSDYDGNLRVLRNNWKLADVAAGGVSTGPAGSSDNGSASEFERLKRVRQWVREQWQGGWNIGKLNYIPQWDARLTLMLSGNGNALGMCTHYATTYVQCSQALGYTSRSIFRGHALSETWSNDFGKWIVMDAGFDPNDKRRATYHFTRRGKPETPLTELEVHRAYWVEKKWDDIEVVATNASEKEQKPEEALGVKKEEMFKGMQEIFLPLRNNFIDHREPEEPEHGEGYFKFLGFLLWKDSATPDITWSDFYTTREADLYWTLNQTQIFLHAAPAKAPEKGSALRVMFDTVTPNFAGYEYKLDDGAWQTWTPADAAKSPGVQAYPMRTTGGSIAFDWPIHPGVNTLEARTVNKAGLRGITSRARVTGP